MARNVWLAVQAVPATMSKAGQTGLSLRAVAGQRYAVGKCADQAAVPDAAPPCCFPLCVPQAQHGKVWHSTAQDGNTTCC